MKKITSIAELKKEAEYNEKNGWTDFFILLNYGLRSSKRICYYADTNTFDIHNEIDDSYQENLTEDDLGTETHIMIAIEKEALFKNV